MEASHDRLRERVFAVCDRAAPGIPPARGTETITDGGGMSTGSAQARYRLRSPNRSLLRRRQRRKAEADRDLILDLERAQNRGIGRKPERALPNHDRPGARYAAGRGIENERYVEP